MTGAGLSGKMIRRLYKFSFRRADWKRAQKGGAGLLVKGTNRHVIVVRSPDPQVFEEAIFVLREEYLRGRRAEQAMEEARRTASEYLRRQGEPERKQNRFRGFLFTLAGVLAMSAVWIAMRLFGV